MNSKRLKRKFTLAFASLVLTGACSFTTTGCFSEFQLLKPISQVRQDAKIFDADLLVMDKHIEAYQEINEIVRLKHNFDKPIYVYVDKSINDKTKGLIQQSLDYVENIFSYINNKYTFEMVEKNEKINFPNETTIEYSLLTENGFANGLNSSFVKNLQSTNITEFFNVSSKIYLAPSLIDEDNDKKILYTLTHELLHSFGFGDFYSGNKDLSSFMMSDSGNFYEIISPNDFRALYAAYGDKHLTNNEIDNTKVKEIQKMLDDYEIYYHNFIFKKITSENAKKITEFKVLDIEKNEFNNKKFATQKKSGYVPVPWYNIDINGADTEIFIKNNKVDIKLYYYNEYFQTCSGEVLYGQNYILLKDLKIYKENYKGPYFEKYDLYLYKTNENQYQISRVNKTQNHNFENYPINIVENVETTNFTF